MRVIRLSNEHLGLVNKFCAECVSVGYNNNGSLEAMKWGGKYDLPSGANYWALVVNSEIASISGSHSYSDTHEELRCLFRSATLPRYQKLLPGISKTHMNSVPFSLLLPEQINWGLDEGYSEFYITTSHGSHDASGKMSRTHRALELLAKQNIVEFVRREEYYYTPQTIWRINLPRYWEAVDSFRAGLRDIGF